MKTLAFVAAIWVAGTTLLAPIRQAEAGKAGVAPATATEKLQCVGTHCAGGKVNDLRGTTTGTNKPTRPCHKWCPHPY